MDVVFAEWLVKEMEGLKQEAFDRLAKRKKFMSFMDEYFTAKCMTDFWVYLYHFLYFNARGHYWRPYHKRLCRILQTWRVDCGRGVPEQANTIFLVTARYLCKTQTSIAWLIWEFIRDQNKRAFIRSYKQPKASQILSPIKQIITSPRHQIRFPWLRPMMARAPRKPIRWSDSELLFDREDKVRTPSIETCGMTTDPTGSHYHLGLGDDLEVSENASSDKEQPILFQTFEDDVNLFAAGSRRLIVGTPWWPDALIDSALFRKGRLADKNYGLFAQPVYTTHPWQPFDGIECTVMTDRVTVRCPQSVLFPSGGPDMAGCQAKLSFYSQALTDTVVEVREIVHNDDHSFRVNRPFPVMLGQPISWYVGNNIPVAPNRHTMDSEDWEPGNNVPLPHTVAEAWTDKRMEIARKSLPRAAMEQGSFVFATQNLLDARNQASMYLNPNLLEPFDEYPDGEKAWFRAADLASSKKTVASTSIMTGFWDEDGHIWIDHLFHKNQANVPEILLELLLGQLRVRKLGHEIYFTTFEKAMLEHQVLQELHRAEKDPYAYFKELGRTDTRYITAAESFFQNIGNVYVPIKAPNRLGDESKHQRIMSIQPPLQQRRIHYKRDMEHADVLKTEIGSFCPDRKALSYDTLDNLADIVREGFRPGRTQKEEPTDTLYDRLQLKARKAYNNHNIGDGWERWGAKGTIL